MLIEHNIFESNGNNCKWFILEAVLPPEDDTYVDGAHMNMPSLFVTYSKGITNFIDQIEGPELKLGWSWGLAVLVGT